MKQLLVAGLVAVTTAVVVSAPVEGAPEDYVPRVLLTFADAVGETSDAGADLVSGTVTIDPNVGDGLLDVTFAGSGPEGDILLVKFGQISGENCQTLVEVLVSTSPAVGGPLVRNFGSTATPEIGDGASSPILFTSIPDSALLKGLDVDCGSAEVRTAGDVLLDEAEMSASFDPVEAVGPGSLQLGGVDLDTDPVIQGEPGVPVDLRMKLGLTGDTRAYDVSVTFTPSAGVTLTPDLVEADVMGELTAIDTSVHRLKADLQLTIPSPGMHSLTVDLAIGNGSPVSWQLDLWGRGGTLTGLDDSLAGTGYVGQRSFNPGTQQLGWRLWNGVWFVDGQWAWIARRHTLEAWTPSYGVPAECGPEIARCVQYDYSAETGELIINGWYGELGEADGWWGWEPITKFEPDGRDSAVYQQRLAKLGPGTISFTGKNVFRKDETRAFGRTIFTIRLGKDGTFRRTFRQELFETTKTSTTTGTYTLGSGGRLTLRKESGEVNKTFLLAVADATGTARPNTLGLWLDGVWYQPS